MAVSLNLQNLDPKQALESLLEDVSIIVTRQAPHLAPLLSVFSQEARFGRAWLTPELARLNRGAEVLEVGAGLMLLSCQLVSEGFKVTALEPIGEGFSSFRELQEIVSIYAVSRGISPEVLAIPVEELRESGTFDFAFSVNVMEHVGDIAMALAQIGLALRPGAVYRFTCANYLFPYEPHFNIPTVLSKSWTEKLFHSRIFSNSAVADAEGLWNSLNWITVPKVALAVRNLPEMSITFDRSMLEAALLRVVNDSQFSARRSPWVRSLASRLVNLGLHRLAKWVPPSIQPIMDCSMKRLTCSS